MDLALKGFHRFSPLKSMGRNFMLCVGGTLPLVKNLRMATFIQMSCSLLE